MKKAFRFFGLTLSSMVLLLAITFIVNAQEQEKKETKRHIKIVRVVDGQKVSLDTIVENDNPFVWNGDTIKGSGGIKHMKGEKGKWASENIYEFRTSGDTKGGKMVIVGDSDGKVMMHQFDGMNDSVKHIVIRKQPGSNKAFIWHGKPGDENFDFEVPPIPPAPPVPSTPRVVIGNRMLPHFNANVIDLSDPGIISYRKKKMKDGTEKIEIVRKQVKEGDVSHLGAGVVVTPKTTGEIEWVGEGGPGKVRVEKIVRDGKLIQIEEVETGDGGKEVKVEVEVQDEKAPVQEKKK